MNTPILDKLKKERVFSIERVQEGTVSHDMGGEFCAMEQCDEYFWVCLTREDLLALAEEIRGLANE